MTKFDAAGLERGLACTPGTVPTFSGAIAAVEKIRRAAASKSCTRQLCVSHKALQCQLSEIGTSAEVQVAASGSAWMHCDAP